MIAIIDYGVGNLRSISKSVELLGGKPVITTDKKIVSKSSGIILPGVGAFKPAMKMLRNSGLAGVIGKLSAEGRPILGICLGMQLFFTLSREGGVTKGLGLIDGTVEKLPVKKLKLPQMGWNNVRFQITNPVFNDVKNNSYFYFVHSYYCKPKDKKTVIAVTDYSIKFPSVIRKGNIIGTQFHPEKSSGQGLNMLKNFVELAKKPC
ncbi:MAG: imidazole glycerol phosphate synthase, glutamine amidotransferase subunit [Elusimicrobia bacterium RIFOXYB2_FULL_48_7]|nr:MAG: imidazole glycerol phosphate synthase, glutamine amidotransferase subunit [Elusimicrobia bacterium RIFOXYB2_FULL_48_7]